MRLGIIIIGMTLIAACLVVIRREDVRLRHEIQLTQTKHIELRREVWDRQMELAHLLTPTSIQYRIEALDIGLSVNGRDDMPGDEQTARVEPTLRTTHRPADGLPDFSD